MSVESQAGQTETGDHLTALAHGGRRHDHRILADINARQALFLEYMVAGCRHASACARIGVEPDEPLTLEQAADLAGIRRRNARRLSATPFFQKRMAEAVRDLRRGHTLHDSRSWRNVKCASRRMEMYLLRLSPSPHIGLAADTFRPLFAAALSRLLLWRL